MLEGLKKQQTQPTPYSFEVIKIVLLDESNSTILDVKVADSNETGLLSVADILHNVEKSYDKGKFLLEESKKSDAWDAYTTMLLM